MFITDGSLILLLQEESVYPCNKYASIKSWRIQPRTTITMEPVWQKLSGKLSSSVFLRLKNCKLNWTCLLVMLNGHTIFGIQTILELKNVEIWLLVVESITDQCSRCKEVVHPAVVGELFFFRWFATLLKDSLTVFFSQSINPKQSLHRCLLIIQLELWSTWHRFTRSFVYIMQLIIMLFRISNFVSIEPLNSSFIKIKKMLD